MNNDLSLTEDENSSETNERSAANSSQDKKKKQNKKNTTGEETTKKKRVKTAADDAAIAKSEKKAAKNSLPEKDSKTKVKPAEPKPAKVKKASAEKIEVAEEKIDEKNISDEQKSNIQAATIPKEDKPAKSQRENTDEKPISVIGKTLSAVSAALEKITFKIKFQTYFGQSLYVTGNHTLLGNNNAENAFALSYLNEDYWTGTLLVPQDAPLAEDIFYSYILKNPDNTIIAEWGNEKIFQPSAFKAKEVLLIDSWNSSSFVENTFYTEPFQKVFLKDNETQVENTTPENATHTFKVKAPLLTKGQTLCISGSAPEIGKWDTKNTVLLSKKAGEVWHTVSLDLSNAVFPFAYKYGVFDTINNKFIQYENGKNRLLDDNTSPDKLTVVSDGFAVLPYNFKGAGVAIPVFSLRSENSFGTGEFADLKLLADWAKQTGLKLIQILPVNDTTATHTAADSYPYAAISAYALHPLYLHLPSLINDDTLWASWKEKQQELNSTSSVDYVEVMAAKWAFIKQVFPGQKQQVFQNEDFKSFFNENAHWLIPYAAFCYLKEKYSTVEFSSWPENHEFHLEQIKTIASSPLQDRDEVSMYYFVQYHLHLQLKDAANYAHENEIILKGDVPIGIYRNSCDAWQEPALFNMNMQAGAPPDNFAVKGQNWGFPIYNWQRMRDDNFAWWKNRFKQMSLYFDAFRIDHILGFFRIWSIPAQAVEGIMGHFFPAVPVYLDEFAQKGLSFNAERYTKPYITISVLAEIFGDGKESIITQFLDLITRTNFRLKPQFDTQKKADEYFSSLEDTEQNKSIKSGLFSLISNVIFFEAEGAEGKEFHFRIAMETTPSFRQFDVHTQYLLKELYINYFYQRQDNFWKKEALSKLPELKQSTNMLICGEDLGMVPGCVPEVMKELAILSLEIQRMPKNAAQEFFHPNDAPYLSVVTPSTHDMSTVRGWWEEDRAATQRFYNNELGQWGTAPYFCEPRINKIIIMQHLYAPAMWSIFQLQDLLGINETLRRENPNEERINMPADPKHYWRYRMHLTLEQLINEKEFTSELKGYIVQSGR